MGRYKLVILIPARNESKTIMNVTKKIKKFGDILVIDDNSSDNTIKLLKNKKIKYLSNKYSLGYEKTIIKGLKYLIKKKYSHIATFDADGEHDANFFLNIIKFKEYDLVIGKRKKFNRIIESIFSFFTNFFLKIEDPLSGLKVYKINTLKKIKLDNDNTLSTSIILKIMFLNGKIIHKNLNVFKRKDNSRLGNNISANLKIISSIIKFFTYSNKFKSNV